MTTQFTLNPFRTQRFLTASLLGIAIDQLPNPPNDGDELQFNEDTNSWSWATGGSGAKGPDGPPGPPGPLPGIQGPAGPPGEDGNTGPAAVDIWHRVSDVSATEMTIAYNPAFPTLATDNWVAGPNSTENSTNTSAMLAFINNSTETGVGSIRIGIADGTTWREASRGRASVGLNRRNTASGTTSTTLGQDTLASATGTFAVGTLSKASGNFSAGIGNDCEVSGGTGNFCSCRLSQLNTGNNMGAVGGTQNALAANQTATESFRGAGANHTISGQAAVCVGGTTHTVTGQNAVAANGNINGNISGTNAFATGQSATASGANCVCCNVSETASGVDSIAVSGAFCVASGATSTVLSCINTPVATASGTNSVVLIGTTASNTNSFACGLRASSTHTDSFAFSGSALTSSIGNQSFTVRCEGTGRFYSNAALSTGVLLATNGNAWGMISEKRLKENFVDCDGLELTKRLRRVPLYKFNYVGNDSSRVCYGPMATDWHAAFNDDVFEGRTNRDVIEGMDMDGVALAVVKELYARLTKINDVKRALALNA